MGLETLRALRSSRFGPLSVVPVKARLISGDVGLHSGMDVIGILCIMADFGKRCFHVGQGERQAMARNTKIDGYFIFSQLSAVIQL